MADTPDWGKISEETRQAWGKDSAMKKRLVKAESLLQRVRDGAHLSDEELDEFLGKP